MHISSEESHIRLPAQIATPDLLPPEFPVTCKSLAWPVSGIGLGGYPQAGTRDILTGSDGHHSRWRITVNFTIELEEETDGRWIAEVPEIRGA